MSSGADATVRGNSRRWALVAAVVTPLLMAVGCGDGTRPVEGAFSVEYSDGQVLRFSSPPHRVFPANAGVVDLLTALVGPERLAAVPQQAFAWSILAEKPDGFAELPTVARYVAEPILRLEVDLVVAGPFNDGNTTARLRQYGIPVLTLPELDSVARVVLAIDMLGAALDRRDRATQLIGEVRERVARLEARAEGARRWRAVHYANYGSGGWSAAGATAKNEILRLAGLTNLTAADGRTGTVTTSFEKLLALDPEVIVISDGTNSSREVLEGEARLAEVDAVRSGRIVVLPARLLSASSHEIITAAERLAAALDRLAGAKDD